MGLTIYKSENNNLVNFLALPYLSGLISKRVNKMNEQIGFKMRIPLTSFENDVFVCDERLKLQTYVVKKFFQY